MDRRKFIKHGTHIITSGAAATSGLWLLGKSLNQNHSPGRLDTKPAVLRPPGAQSEQDFLAVCIRCQRCQDACPSFAIQLAGPNDPTPLGTPFINASENPCTLCLNCTTACPTGALKVITKKEDVNMGLAVVDERTCVSFNGSGVCGACHTACPLKNKAITQGLHNTPIIHEEYCVGCGMCEAACIVKGTKAIRVFSGRGMT